MASNPKILAFSPDQWTTEQQDMALLAMRGTPRKEIADQLGLDISEVREFLNRPEVRAHMQEAKAERWECGLKVAMESLLEGYSGAIKQLVLLSTAGEKDADQIRACEAVHRIVMDHRQLELADQMAALEARMEQLLDRKKA